MYMHESSVLLQITKCMKQCLTKVGREGDSHSITIDSTLSRRVQSALARFSCTTTTCGSKHLEWKVRTFIDFADACHVIRRSRKVMIKTYTREETSGHGLLTIHNKDETRPDFEFILTKVGLKCVRWTNYDFLMLKLLIRCSLNRKHQNT